MSITSSVFRSDLAVGELAVHVVADSPPDLAHVAHAAPTQRLHVTALGGAPAPAHGVSLKILILFFEKNSINTEQIAQIDLQK